MINQAELLAFSKNWHITEVQTDGNGDQIIFLGKTAAQDAAANVATWCIKKITVTNTTSGTTTKQTIVEQYADGDTKFDNKWSERTTKTYKYLV